MAASRVGFWYATSPAEKEYRPADPEFSVHTVVSDLSEFPAHVTVENAVGQQFPVALALIESIASPPGHIYSRTERKFAKMEKTALVQGSRSDRWRSGQPVVPAKWRVL